MEGLDGHGVGSCCCAWCHVSLGLSVSACFASPIWHGVQVREDHDGRESVSDIIFVPSAVRAAMFSEVSVWAGLLLGVQSP